MATVKLFNHHIRTPFLFLMLTEYALLFCSVYIGLYLRYDAMIWQPHADSLQNFPVKSAIYAVVMIFGMIAMGLYQSPGTQGRYIFPSVFIRVVLSMILGTIALFMIYYVFPSILIGRGITGYALVSSVISVSLYRTMVYRLMGGKALRKKVLVLGVGELAADLIRPEFGVNTEIVGSQNRQNVLSPPYASYSIHGFVNIANEEVKVPEKYLVSTGDDLASYCEDYGITEVVLAVEDRRSTIPVEQLLECKLSNIDIAEYVAFWEKEKGLLRTDMLNPSWLIFCEGCSEGDLESIICRIFDLTASLLILVLMSPVLLITAMAIFVENSFSGPIFYKQERVGLNGKTFQLYKFRSMIVNAEKDGKAQWAEKNDARITMIGQFIRKVRIDELPQMWNIFKGDMSLVGPRPERPEFVEILEKKIPFFSTRHRVKPGLAGWAQIKYPYGADEYDAQQKLQYDLYYVKNHSVIMDLLVLIQTVEVVLLGKGAR